MYPDNCIRGISNKNELAEDGSVSASLFYFSFPEREDGWKELSINWMDDDVSVEFSMDQKKDDGSIQFKAGLAIIPREEIERLSRSPTLMKGILTYERKILDNNPYHGNLLLHKDVSKSTMKKIAAGLALAVSEIIPRTP